jgi:endoglucanase
MPLSANAQLPTATQTASEMTIGWNVGNSLEVPDGETAWGNPKVTRQLIDAVHDAGFNTLRIPCAWNSHADQSTLEIDQAWLARVKEVVDYGYANGMYVILNSHWDNGWLEENPY